MLKIYSITISKRICFVVFLPFQISTLTNRVHKTNDNVIVVAMEIRIEGNIIITHYYQQLEK